MRKAAVLGSFCRFRQPPPPLLSLEAAEAHFLQDNKTNTIQSVEYGTLPAAYFSSFHLVSLSKSCPSAALIQPQVLFMVLHCGDTGSSFFLTLVTCRWVTSYKLVWANFAQMFKTLYEILDTKIPNMSDEFAGNGQNDCKVTKLNNKTSKLN